MLLLGFIRIWQNLWRRFVWPVTHCLPCPLVFSLTIIYCISSTPGQLSWLCISRWGLSLVTQSLSSGAQCASSRSWCTLQFPRGLKRPSNKHTHTHTHVALEKLLSISSPWGISREEMWNVKYSSDRKSTLWSPLWDLHCPCLLFTFHSNRAPLTLMYSGE